MPQPISTAPLDRPVMTEYGPAIWQSVGDHRIVMTPSVPAAACGQKGAWVLCFPCGGLLANKFESHLEGEIEPAFWEEIPEWMKNPPQNSSPFNADDWRFELSSGFNGYRNKFTGEWIYENEFFWRQN